MAKAKYRLIDVKIARDILAGNSTRGAGKVRTREIAIYYLDAEIKRRTKKELPSKN